MKKQKVYGIVCDGGDGSAYMLWFRNKDFAQKRLDDDEDYSYTANEGQISEEFTFPEDLDLEKAGFRFPCEEEEGE